MSVGSIDGEEASASTVGSPVVVKLGGTTIAEQQDILSEIVLERQRRPVVVVHGGGKRITEWLDRLGVTSRFEGGRRVTDDATLEVFLAVMGGVINAELTAELLALGADAVGVRGIDGRTIRESGPRGSASSSPSPWPTPRCSSHCWRTAGCPCWHRWASMPRVTSAT